MDSKQVGALLARIRKDMGLSQEQLAELLRPIYPSATQTQVSRWEKDATMPVPVFLGWCKALRVDDISAQFGVDVPAPRWNETGKNFLREIQTMMLARGGYIVEDDATGTIPLYETSVAAGQAEPAGGDEAQQIPRTADMPEGTEFAVRVNGNSMEPTYTDGQTIYVKRALEVPYGKAAIFLLNGALYCKRLEEQGNGRVALVSDNGTYPPMLLKEHDDLQCRGVVLS